MFFADHALPHFHAEYGGSEAQFETEDLALLVRQASSQGSRPGGVEWASVHQPELREAWRRVQRASHPGKIKPLA